VGVYTALKLCQRDRLMILSGDIPLIKPEVLRLLMEEFREPVTVFLTEGRLHPLVGIYSKALYPLMEEYLKLGRRNLTDLLRSLEFKVIGEDKLRQVDPRLESLTNMNTREDLSLIQERMR